MDRRSNATIASLIAAAGLGALAMFVLDPGYGARRLMRESADAAGASWRGLRRSVSDVAAGVRQRVLRTGASDRELEQRVRAELGRWVLHPHAIDICARSGVVVLGGSVLAAEQAQLRRAVEGVRGVVRVEARVAAHDSPEALPKPPSDASSDAEPRPVFDRRASPATLLGISASVALVASGLVRRGEAGLLLTAAGLAIAADVAIVRRRRRLADEREAQPRSASAVAAPAPRSAEHSAERAARAVPQQAG